MPGSSDTDIRAAVARNAANVGSLADQQQRGFEKVQEETDDLDARLRACEQRSAAVEERVSSCQRLRRDICPGLGDGKALSTQTMQAIARQAVLEYSERHPAMPNPGESMARQRARQVGIPAGAAGLVYLAAEVVRWYLSTRGAP